jgi:hypothetical protein
MHQSLPNSSRATIEESELRLDFRGIPRNLRALRQFINAQSNAVKQIGGSRIALTDPSRQAPWLRAVAISNIARQRAGSAINMLASGSTQAKPPA